MLVRRCILNISTLVHYQRLRRGEERGERREGRGDRRGWAEERWIERYLSDKAIHQANTEEYPTLPSPLLAFDNLKMGIYLHNNINAITFNKASQMCDNKKRGVWYLALL
jgi:hypothetical protein